jgi:hypothetical protein
MDRISVQVIIDNQSDAVLQLINYELDHGEWTNDVTPPATIAAFSKGGYESEGHLVGIVPSTGTEGRARYSINAPGNVGELYIHWDSPLVNSQYGNTYHIWCPVGWELAEDDGQGHNAVCHIRLRRTAFRSVPNFDPRGRGFAFVNHWSSSLPAATLGFVLKTLYSNQACIGGVISQIAELTINLTTAGAAPIVISAISDTDGPALTNASSGLCGGMTYAVMDYYNAHLLPPTNTTSPTSENDPIFQYVRQRQMDSFDFEGQGCRFLVYPLSVYPNGDSGFVQEIGLWKGRAWVTYRDAWRQIQADIDAGQLSPMGLIHSENNDLSDNHQVLAYGYERSGQGVTLYILDPNHTRQVVTYQFDITDTSGAVHLTQMVGGVASNEKPIYCFFRIDDYAPQSPPDGRPFTTSLRDSILAATGQSGAVGVRSVVGGQSSIRAWMGAL